MQIESTLNYQSHKGIKILLYGLSGIGKTHLISTAPNPIVISTEGRLLALSHLNIPFVKVTSKTDFDQLYTLLTTDPSIRDRSTLCIDSASDIAERILIDLKSQYKDQRQAYTNLFDSVAQFVKKINDEFPLNTYWIAQQESFIDDLGKVSYIPSMPGKALTQWFPYQFDERFALRSYIDQNTRQEIRYIQTVSDSQYQLKESSGKLPAYCPADLNQIFTTINNPHQ